MRMIPQKQSPIRFHRVMLALLSALLGLCLPTSPVRATGGLISEAGWAAVEAGHIAFLVDRAQGVITAYIGLDYQGVFPATGSEGIAWILPLPAAPIDVQLADRTARYSDLLDTIYRATNFQIVEPPNPCRDLFPDNRGDLGDGLWSVRWPTTDTYTLLDSSAGVLDWLEAHGQPTPASSVLSSLRQYDAEGTVFLALYFDETGEANVSEGVAGYLQRLRVTYPGDQVSLPLGLLTPATIQTPITVTIFADEPYAPENATYATLDLAAFQDYQRPHSLADVFGSSDLVRGQDHPLDISTWFPPLVAELARLRTQGSFVMKAAGPTATVLASAEDPLLPDIIAQYPYLTTYLLWPGTLTDDPRFVPAASAPDYINTIDFNAWVNNPVEYWGCTSRTALSAETLENLPDGRHRQGIFSLAYPADWVLSEFTLTVDDSYPPTVYAFAPQPVTEADLEAYLAGEESGPMFILLASRFAARAWEMASRFHPGYSGGSAFWYDPFSLAGGREFELGHWLAVMTTPEDWAANRPMYSAMLAYAHSYQYYLSPDFPNTLFVTVPPRDGVGLSQSAAMLAYPAGWTEFTRDAREFWLLPEGASPDDAGPYMHLIPVSHLVEWDASQGEDALFEALSQALTERYQLPFPINPARMREMFWGCWSVSGRMTIPFDDGIRAGSLRLKASSEYYVVEVSAPSSTYATYARILRDMLEAFSEVTCG